MSVLFFAGSDPGWANLKPTIFLCQSAPEETRWAGILPPAAHPPKGLLSPTLKPQASAKIMNGQMTVDL